MAVVVVVEVGAAEQSTTETAEFEVKARKAKERGRNGGRNW